jgi:hypothetical protein
MVRSSTLHPPCARPARAIRAIDGRRVGDLARRSPATIHWRYGHHGPVEGPANPGSTAPSPDEGGDGVAPAQPLPAAEPASHHDHRRALLGQCRPSSSPWPATAGPAPPPAGRCRAPDTADRRSCRMAGREYGRPGNARCRSAECTDRCRRAWASKYSGGPCRAPSRARWRSPRAGASSGAPRGLTALGLLPGSDQPTKQAGTAKPERIAHSPYSPPVWTAGQSLRAAGDPKETPDASCTVAVSISYVNCTARVAEQDRPNRSSIVRSGRSHLRVELSLAGPGVSMRDVSTA